MENFQLYRTNLHLGGQLKWDIIIDSSESKLLVSDFHLRPISDNISYTYKTDERLLNNSHQDNVKLYYNSIKGNFYNEGLDSMFNHNWPVICKENEILNSYSNIYDMGCKRMKHYSLYNRQFEFFCPIWIENLTESLVFKFNVKAHGSDIILSSKTLNITNEINKEFAKTHNKFVSYFKNYIKDSGLKTGDDNILNIKFNAEKTSISGLNVETGLFCSKDIIGFISDLKHIERPMMETDNMLAKLFSGNNIVTKQLFNLNLCFNLSDIISDVIFNMLNGEKLTVDLEIYIDGKKLEKRDFYTNYEFIDRSVKNPEDGEKYNVFDYLKDYKSLDLIDKNKFCQSIFHWSLSDNNEYIFNLYDGFSGLYVENNGEEYIDESGKSSIEPIYVYHENSHQYKDFPNLVSGKADNINNSTGWINTEVIKYWNSFYKYISNTEKNKLKGTYINGNNFINGVKYRYIPKVSHNDKEGIYIIGLCVTYDIFLNIENNIDRFNLIKIPVIDNKVTILRKDDLIMIVVKDINDLAYKNMSLIFMNNEEKIYSYINKISNNDHEDTEKNLGKEIKFIDVIFAILKNAISPELIMFNSLAYTTVNGPSKNVDEIEYLKSNDYNYVCRYDGKLKPTFISENLNALYFKDYVSDNRVNGDSKLIKTPYIKFMNSGFEPKYPSIEYFPIKKIENWNYNELPIVKSSEHICTVVNDIEYAWFEDNVCLILSDKLKFIKENKKAEGYKTLKELLQDCISEYYKTDNERLINYIISKYNISSNWEYASLTNIDDYIYDITLTLK